MVSVIAQFLVHAAAQSIINALIAGESPVATEPPRLLSPDWSGDLDIQSAASSIVDHLMNKPLDISLAVEEEQQHVTDPRVAMEMRHRKVLYVPCILLQHSHGFTGSGCVMFCVTLYCIVCVANLYCIAVHSNSLYCIVLYCIVL